ncbi:uncharacterized protein LOC142619648 isoform X2 [Castanea sativa]|uniref:uncharacterized protein LOC142619648 isoform X2 n=1 Tax=Castanea sativa TaxID=21020 RepID=UPI003F64A938
MAEEGFVVVGGSEAEEAVVADPNPNSQPDHHKRKLEDLELGAPEHGHIADLNADPEDVPADGGGDGDGDDDEDDDGADVAEPVKRQRLDEKSDGSANENGYQQKEENGDEPVGENNEEPNVEGLQSEDAQPLAEEVRQTVADGEEAPSVENPEMGDAQQPSVEDSVTENAQDPSKVQNQEPFTEGADTTSRKMEVPNNKVGVLIGKAGDTIRYLQYNSGAKIQITRDADADPQSATRPVEIIGTLDSITKAEKLINAVIAEADAGGSPSLIARGLTTAQAAAASEQVQIQVPNEKVGLIIGRGGETIKGLQTRTGARIQLIPQHLPEGDESKERTVRVTGDKKQIEMARELIKEVMSQPVRPSSFSGGFNQQAYRPRGSTGPPQWGPRGPHPAAYDYQHRGPYPSHNPQYPSPGYGGYHQQAPPRGNYSGGWEQRPSMQGPPSHTGGYDYYGGQGGHMSDAPASAQHSAPIPSHGHGPSHAAAMGPPSSQANYNYGQPQGPDYGHTAPYSQAAPHQQSYGHGYDEPKYESHAPTQHPYGGHGSSQPVYSQTQPGYAAQQYGKPQPYGQGPHPQSYAPPRATQPGEMPYQGTAPAQSYGPNATPQQPYPYQSSGQMQQSYPPYGSAPAADAYNQPPPASGPVYPQQGGQPGYGQPGAQQAQGYAQVGPTGGYGPYAASQQGYPEQAAPNNAAYGYQGPQDPAYSGAPASAYSAPPSGQPGYAQPAPTQQGYDQSVPQSGGYGSAPATAPVAYGKTVSPQPGYAQYDSTQMYGAPR